jgi:hypothetical protein
MCVPVDAECGVVLKCLLCTSGRNVTELREAAQRFRDFDVEQVRSVMPLFGSQHEHRHALAAIGSEQQLEKRRRVDDDQRPSRSSRTTSVGDTCGAHVKRRALRMDVRRRREQRAVTQ